MARLKSTIITNIEAVPPKVIDARYFRGKPGYAVGRREIAASDDDDDIVEFFPVHSSWIMLDLVVRCDAITGSTDWDFGLHDTTENGAGEVDHDLFAIAVDLSSAIVTGTSILFEAQNIDNVNKPLWEALGLSADPDKWYYLTGTANTIGSGAGGISLTALFGEGT